jgi:hypothetical protein
MKKTPEPLSTAVVEAALRRAFEKAVCTAKQTGTPIILWEDGRVREISVEEWEARRTDQADGAAGSGKTED